MLSRFSNSLWRAQRLTGLRIRNRKILKWEKRHRLLPGQGNDGFFFFLSLAFLRRTAAVRWPLRQRNPPHESCQHNLLTYSSELCHEISGGKVASIAQRRQRALLELLIVPWKPQCARRLTILPQSPWPEPPYKEKPYPEPSYLPTYVTTYLPAGTHTHPVHLPEKGTIQYWSRKDRLTSAEDWNGKSILEYLTVPQFPLWLPPNAEIDRFALTLAFYVPSFFLLWYSCCPSGRFKDYQELFPPFSQEVQPEVQAVRRKPSKMPTTYLQESQVSEENSEDWTLVGDKKTAA